MVNSLEAFCAVVLFCLAVAQWLNYPTAGVPRNPDGTVNLNAPTPRTADGKPDFSGLWEPLKNKPCPPEGCDDIQVPQEFGNIGWSAEGRPLPFQPWAHGIEENAHGSHENRRPCHQLPPGGRCRHPHGNLF